PTAVPRSWPVCSATMKLRRRIARPASPACRSLAISLRAHESTASRLRLCSSLRRVFTGRTTTLSRHRPSSAPVMAPGSARLGTLIMGADGRLVEKFVTDAGAEANLNVTAAEFTSLVRTASRSGKDLDLGDLRELVVTLSGVTLVMRLFNKDYFAVLALRPE